MKLRWGATLGQSLAIGVARYVFDVPLMMAPLLCICVLGFGINVWLTRLPFLARSASEGRLSALVALDVIVLTLLLSLSGGANNPFYFLYVIPLSLAALTLGSHALARITLLCTVCVATLFFWHAPLHLEASPVSHHLHTGGMGGAFLLSALFIVYFVRRLSTALAITESALEDAHILRARDEKLTSLGTLAANAAHELATPLGVIAVVAKELQRQLGQKSPSLPSALEDAALITQEVSRCRDVLSQMTYDTGAAQGEAFGLVTLRALLLEAAASLKTKSVCISVQSDRTGTEPQVRVPIKSALHALRGIFRNAADAAEGSPVDVHASSVAGTCFIRVSDSGKGMTPEVLARATEPFFTTKGPGVGMGLGLFLARSTFERLGGGILIESRLAHGTTVVARLPLDGYASSQGTSKRRLVRFGGRKGARHSDRLEGHESAPSSISGDPFGQSVSTPKETRTMRSSEVIP